MDRRILGLTLAANKPALWSRPANVRRAPPKYRVRPPSIRARAFFRGHFLTTLRNGLGTSRVALIAASGITVVVFALLHGYQGWAGVIDAGLYGGLVLTVLFLWRRGRLTACVVAHAAWNSLATVGIWLWY